MNRSKLFSENAGIEPKLSHRRILPFCAAVLAGISVCTLYLSGALPERVDQVVISLPNPPAPLSETTSPYPAADKTNEGPSLKLEVMATQDAWVEVETDGQNKCRKLVRVEEGLSFQAFERIRIMTGNSAGIELRFNGKPVATTGTNRRILTLEFTNQGILEVNSRNS